MCREEDDHFETVNNRECPNVEVTPIYLREDCPREWLYLGFGSCRVLQNKP